MIRVLEFQIRQTPSFRKVAGLLTFSFWLSTSRKLLLLGNTQHKCSHFCCSKYKKTFPGLWVFNESRTSYCYGHNKTSSTHQQEEPVFPDEVIQVLRVKGHLLVRKHVCWMLRRKQMSYCTDYQINSQLYIKSKRCLN